MRLIVCPANWLRFTVAVVQTALSFSVPPSSWNTVITEAPDTILTWKKSAVEELVP